MPSADVRRSVMRRAGRTFLQTFLAVVLSSPLLSLGWAGIKAAAIAGIASVLSMIHRLLDETPVPTLADTPGATPPRQPRRTRRTRRTRGTRGTPDTHHRVMTQPTAQPRGAQPAPKHPQPAAVPPSPPVAN